MASRSCRARRRHPLQGAVPIVVLLLIPLGLIIAGTACQGPSLAAAAGSQSDAGDASGANVNPESNGDSDLTGDPSLAPADDPSGEDEAYEYTIEAAPIAPDKQGGVWDFKVVSTSRAAGDSLQFIWDFGDGETREGPHQVYNFAAGGTYNISVTGIKPNGRVAFVLTLDVEVAMPPLPDQPPVADAGPDQTVEEGEQVCLDGRGSSDANDDPLTFAWNQISGVTVELVEGAPGTVYFLAPEVDQGARLVFALEVSDGYYTAEDTVAVDVLNLMDPASAPVADAGPDQDVTAGELVTLDGSNSFGAGSGVLSFLWSQTAGTPVTLSADDLPIISFVAPDVTEGPEPLIFELTITEDGVSASDDVQVTVWPADAPPGDGDGDPPGEGGGEGPPTLCVSTTALDFGWGTNSLAFEAWNCGGDSLSYTIVDDADWLTVAPTGGDSSGDHDTITVSVDRTDLPEDTYQGEITVTPDVGTSMTILVTMAVFAGEVQPMTTASRTSGVAPLGVFFDAVNTAAPAWTSGVIQPRGFAAQPVNCTGVLITRVNYSNSLGTGTLAYTHANTSMTWTAPGDSSGTAVDVSSGGNFPLASANGNSTLHVWVAQGDLPASNQSDTITVTDGGENADWNSFHFKWEFGDPASGNWSNGATRSDGSYPSKNIAYGVCAAHVYESAGSYTATLTITDDVDGTHQYTRAITVAAEPPGGWTTYYIAEAGDDSNTGTQANPFRSFAKAMLMAGDNVRLLFNRNDDFPVTEMANVSVTGPLYIGAYGTGARPRFTITGTNAFLYCRHLADARFVDLWVDGDYPNQASPETSFATPTANALFLRCRVQDMRDGYHLNNRGPGIVIQECEVVNNALYNFWAWNSRQTAILGCTGSESVSHPLRVYTNKLLVSHCLFHQPTTSYVLRFMSADVYGAEGLWYIVSHNKFIDVGTNPSGDSDTVMPKHMLIDSNEFSWPTEDSRTAITSSGGKWITVRNNRFYSPNSNQFISFRAGYNGHRFHHRNYYIYDNVMSTTTTDWVRFLLCNQDAPPTASNWRVINNILFAPYATNGVYATCIEYRGVPASDPLLASDYNCWHVPNLEDRMFSDSSGPLTLGQWLDAGQDVHSITDSPLLTDPASGDMGLQTSSPCIDAGRNDAVPWCRIDLAARSRPHDGDGDGAAIMDIGASEFRP